LLLLLSPLLSAMKSLRRERNRARSKSQIMTKGGIYDYQIEPVELSTLAQLIDLTPPKQLPFLLDALLTKKELVDIVRRIIIAQMILKDATYEDILKDIHVARNTIALVNHSLFEYDGILKQTLARLMSPNDKYKHWVMSSAERQIFNRIRKGK